LRIFVSSLRNSNRFSTSNRAGGMVLNAHFTSSSFGGRIEHSTIGICAFATIGAAAKLPADTQPDRKISTLSDDIILR
jgi:hypothetical protein